MLDYMRFKEVNDLFVRGDHVKARQLLMRMHAQCIAMHDELECMKHRLQDCEDILFLARNLHFEEHKYWLHGTGVKLGPFCPDCYNNFGILTKLESDMHGERCGYCGYSHSASLSLGVDASREHTPHTCRRIPFARRRA